MFDFIDVEFWLYKHLSFVFYNPIILIGFCLFFIFLIPSKEKPRFRKFKKNLFFSLAIFIFLLLLFELILSFGGYFYFYVYSNLDNPRIEEDAFRILFLGESTTAGTFIDNPQEDAYPTQVERILQRHYPNKKIKCYNRGIGAIETTAILRNFDRNMIKYKPHLVVLMAGNNDYFFKGDQISQIERIYLKSNIYQLIGSIIDSHMLCKTGEEGSFKYGYNVSTDYKRRRPVSESSFNIVSIIRKAHSYGTEIYLAGYLQPDARSRVNPVLEELAQKNNLVYIGDYPTVDFTDNRSLFASEGWHPSKEGHAIIAEKIVERIISTGIIDNNISHNYF